MKYLDRTKRVSGHVLVCIYVKGIDNVGTEYREYSPNVLKINQNTELKKHFHPFSTKNADLKNNFTSLMFEDFHITRNYDNLHDLMQTQIYWYS